MAEQRLTAKVEAFRTRKETIKAQYTAAEAQTKIGEAFTGVSEEMADVGMAIERAENKTETMRARAGAIDELIESGALTDLSDGRDSIDRELEQLSVDERRRRGARADEGRARHGRRRRPSSSAAARPSGDRPHPRARGSTASTRRPSRPSTRSTTASRRRPTPTTTPASRRRSRSWWTRSSGSARRSPTDELEGSDAIVPGHGTTLAEARELLSSEGLIPN